MRRRFHFHFTLTSDSWLNQVERWSGLITDKMIRRGTFHSVQELERAIYAWLAGWNDKPKAFVWKATAGVILDKVRRCDRGQVFFRGTGPPVTLRFLIDDYILHMQHHLDQLILRDVITKYPRAAVEM